MNFSKAVYLEILFICFLSVACGIKKNPDLPDIGKFMVAVQNNDLDTVRYYIKYFNYITNVLVGDGPFGVGGRIHMSPIMVAAAFNKEGTEIFDLLIKNKGHLEYVNEDGMNALLYAAQRNNVIAIEYLLKKGMDVNFTNVNGDSCLMTAICLKSFDAAKVLLEHGAKIDITSNVDGSSVYNMISYLPDIESETILEMLNLFMRYDPALLDVPQKEGFTSFSFAVLNGHYQTIDFYLEHGASALIVLNHVTENLEYLFLSENQKYLIKLLENVDGGLNGANEDGQTLLMRALYYPELAYEIIKDIAEKSENIEQEAKGGITAFMLAIANNRVDAAKLLLEMGADKGREDIAGNTAIKYHERFQQMKNEPINPAITALLK
jgi:ankyrin repeat protein